MRTGVVAGLMWLVSMTTATAAPVIDFLGRPMDPCGRAVIAWADIASSSRDVVDETCDESGDQATVIDPMTGGAGGGLGLMSSLFWTGRALAGGGLTDPPLFNGPFAGVPDSPETTTGLPSGSPPLVRHSPSIDDLGAGGGGGSFLAEGGSLRSFPPGAADPRAINPAVVPEPGTLLLFGTGLALAARRFRRPRRD